jgi:uncharacterized protein (DUF4415 family)
MKEKNITRVTLEEARSIEGKTDWNRLSQEGDFEGEDEDDFEVDWSTAVWINLSEKKPVTMRLDNDILEFFKSQGKGYQTRINAVLRAYMEAQLKR